MKEIQTRGVFFSCIERSLERGFAAEIAKSMLGSHYLPEFNSVSNLEVVLLLESEEEASRLLYMDYFSKGGITYYIQRWKPTKAAEELDWM